MRNLLLVVALCCGELVAIMLCFLPALWTDSPAVIIASTFGGIAAASWVTHAILGHVD